MSKTHPSKRSHRQNIVGLILSLLAGYVLWMLAGLVQRLFQQPRLVQRWPPPGTISETAVEHQAVAIAEADVRRGLEFRLLSDGRRKRVLSAGARHFREPWARDFGFAAYGLLAMNEPEAARDSLEVFFHHQRTSGQFPVKVHSTSVLERYLYALFGREQPIEKPLRPKYRTAHHSIALDGNALLVNAALEYARWMEDSDFIRTWWPQLERAMGWLARHERGEDGLLHQGRYADWADSIARKGHILYSNVLYWKAASEMACGAASIGHHAMEAHYHSLAARLRERINTHFWDDGLGFYTTSQKFRNLSSAGNLLAIAWGLATPDQANRILDNMDLFRMAEPVPTQVVNRPYPPHFIAIENRLAGIPEYHTHAAWLWLGAWHVVALLQAGRLDRAYALFHSISDVIVRDGIVHEVYGRDGRHLSTRWYTAESPLTWNAAMVVYAGHVLNGGDH